MPYLIDFTLPPTVEPSAGWAHKQIQPDLKEGRNVWREVTQEFYDDMLGCVPPIDMHSGAFLVGEPYDHIHGDVIYCALVPLFGRYFARNLPRKQFKPAISALRTVLGNMGPAARVSLLSVEQSTIGNPI